MNGKALTVLNPGSHVEIFSNYNCQKKEQFVFLTDNVTKIS